MESRLARPMLSPKQNGVQGVLCHIPYRSNSHPTAVRELEMDSHHARYVLLSCSTRLTGHTWRSKPGQGCARCMLVSAADIFDRRLAKGVNYSKKSRGDSFIVETIRPLFPLQNHVPRQVIRLVFRLRNTDI